MGMESWGILLVSNRAPCAKSALVSVHYKCKHCAQHSCSACLFCIIITIAHAEITGP